MARTDGLPNPVTVTDLFLAAVLDELRTLNQSGARPSVPLPPDVLKVKEPEPDFDRLMGKKRR